MLSVSDRDFFAKVARASLANPFGDEREQVDRQLAGHAEPEEILARVLTRVEKRLATCLDSHGRIPERTSARDADLLSHAIVFDAFHRYFGAMDAHITAQLAAGVAPIRAGFAPPLYQLLLSRGFAPERCKRLVGLLFQMGRGYFFIARGLLGDSPSMRRLREALWNTIVTADLGRYERALLGRMEDFSTLLLGETGVGKGAAAIAIGRSGFIPYDPHKERFAVSFNRSFVSLNLSEFSETLLESALFGHEKGAFTGAIASYEGALARSSEYGAVFLDEIGDVSIPVQIKLLRVLQERTFSPVGGHQQKRFLGRVIAATHQSLVDLRHSGKFRQDFYYRLCSTQIEVPSLRLRIAENRKELATLVQAVTARTIGAPDVALAEEVLAIIRRDLPETYAWPGNVRELEQCVRRALLTGSCVGVDQAPSAATWLEQTTAGAIDAEALLNGYCRELYRQHATLEAVARITGLDRRTVKRRVGSMPHT